MEWNLSLLFKDVTEIDNLIDKLNENVKNLELVRGKITGFNVSQLFEFLNEYESFLYFRSRLDQYPSLMVSANSKDKDALALRNRITNISTEWNKKLAFITLELGELLRQNPDTIKDEQLTNRQYYLQRILEKSKYRLSEKEEVLILDKDKSGANQWLALQGDLVSKTQFKIMVNGEEMTHSWSSGYGLRSNKDHATRKAAIEGLGSGLQKKGDIYAYALRNVCTNYVSDAKRRGYENYLESSLFTAHLDKKIVDTMLEVLLENVSLFQEFMNIKAKLLGTDKLRGEDFEAPFPFSSTREISWAEAKKIVVDGFSEFDPEFGQVANNMFNSNRVDALPRDGKRAGAFCSTHYEDKSAFIMMSYNQNMNSLGTLAHEMGHAVHAHYITREQPLLHSNIGMPLAETASEFGSLLFNLKFMKEAKSEEEKKSILFNMVQSFMVVMFEVGSRKLFEDGLYSAIDNNEYLDMDKINEIFWKARKVVFGNAIDWLPEQAYHWSWKPHYYFPGFRYYNYPYVFGEFSVLSMYAAYREEPQKFTENYKNLLKAGGSNSPAEMFKNLFGFDLHSKKFWENGIGELRNFVDQCKDYL